VPTVIYGHYEWDSVKNKANKAKHSISFEAAVQIFEGMVIEAPTKDIYGEERITSIGMLENKEIVVISTGRNPRKRIISARRARENERKIYKEFWKKIQ
jgi:uncharacterized DUF497 family protein